MKMKILAMAALSALVATGCTSVAYVENGAVNGSECENTVSIDENGLRAVSMCKGEAKEE